MCPVFVYVSNEIDWIKWNLVCWLKPICLCVYTIGVCGVCLCSIKNRKFGVFMITIIKMEWNEKIVIDDWFVVYRRYIGQHNSLGCENWWSENFFKTYILLRNRFVILFVMLFDHQRGKKRGKTTRKKSIGCS